MSGFYYENFNTFTKRVINVRDSADATTVAHVYEVNTDHYEHYDKPGYYPDENIKPEYEVINSAITFMLIESNSLDIWELDK